MNCEHSCEFFRWKLFKATSVVKTLAYVKKEFFLYFHVIDNKQRRLQLVAGQVMGGGPHHPRWSHSLPRTTGVADLPVLTGEGAPWTRRYSVYFMTIKSCPSFHPYHLIAVVLHFSWIDNCWWLFTVVMNVVYFPFVSFLAQKNIKFL